MQQKQQNTQKPKKPGYLDQIWQALIKPPNKMQYCLKDLGPKNFILQKTIGSREDFQIKNSRDHTIECSYFEPMSAIGKPHPCVIYLHGNSSSRVEGTSLIELLLPNDIALVLMDFAGCGHSQGEYISLGYYEKFDVGLLIDQIKKMKQITKIGIWGRSMGASTAIQVGCMRDDIEVVVADSSFTCITKLCNEVAKKQYKLPKFISSLACYFIRKKIKKKANFDIYDCNTQSAFKEGSFKPSILFLAAKGDQLINFNHSVELFGLYKGHKNILLFEGSHNSKRPKNILSEVSLILKNNLCKQTPQFPSLNSEKQNNTIIKQITVSQVNLQIIISKNGQVRDKYAEIIRAYDSDLDDDIPCENLNGVQIGKYNQKQSVCKKLNKINYNNLGDQQYQQTSINLNIIKLEEQQKQLQ